MVPDAVEFGRRLMLHQAVEQGQGPLAGDHPAPALAEKIIQTVAVGVETDDIPAGIKQQ